MSTDKWNDILQANTTLEEEASGLVDYLSDLRDADKKSFDISAVIPATDGSTSEVTTKIFAVSGIIGKYKGDDQLNLVANATLQQLLDAINATTNSIQSLSSHLRSQITESNALVTFNYSNFHCQTANGQNTNCQPQFKQVYASVETLLTAYTAIVQIINSSSGNFQAAAKALARLLEKVSNDRDKVQEKLADLEAVSVKAENFRNIAETASAEANRLKKNSTSDQQTISEYLAEVTQKQEKVDSIHSQAVELESKIKEYDEIFQSFQRQLDDRNQRFKDGTEKLDNLIQKFNEQEASFDTLINKSEDMLKSATVAGLATHFGTMRDDLTTELEAARRSFYVGIGILIVSALPLLALVLLPVLKIMAPEMFASGEQEVSSGLYFIGQVLARIIILLPAAWFVRFTSIRHGSLFKLREDYAYKYSMAVSVEGFKKQAPDYENEIAAVVFEQLSFNPAEKMAITSKKDGESPSKLMNMFQNMIGKAMDKADD